MPGFLPVDPSRPRALGYDGDFGDPCGGSPEIRGFPCRNRCGEALRGLVLRVRAEPSDVHDMGDVTASQEVPWDGT